MSARGVKSILIASVTAGAGHNRAAQALIETARASVLPVGIKFEDILDYTNPLFKKIYSGIQFAIVRKSPELWGYLYKRTQSHGTTWRKSLLMNVFDRINFRRYYDMVRFLRPDAVICTHFLPYLAIEHKLGKSAWSIPFVSVTTDYDLHSLWVNPAVRRYYVASEEAAWTIRSHGIPEDRIVVTGIPTLPPFQSLGNREQSCAELGLRPNAFTVLVLTGGYGVGVADEMVPSMAQALSDQSIDSQIVVVCGKNEAMLRRLNGLTFPAGVAVKIYPFVAYVDKLMDCADVLVTKAGGLTVTEAITKHLPMIIFDPTPGQEGRNTNYVLENGVAQTASDLANLNFKLLRLVQEPELLSSMRSQARRIARPDSARLIWDDLLTFLDDFALQQP